MNDCEFHGYHKLICPLCKAERIASDKDDLKSGKAVIGVFRWSGRNDYKISDALKTFKSRAVAEKYVDKLNKEPLEINSNEYVTRIVTAGKRN